MAANYADDISKYYSWKKIVVFRFEFDLSLFQKVQLII